MKIIIFYPKKKTMLHINMIWTCFGKITTRYPPHNKLKIIHDQVSSLEEIELSSLCIIPIRIEKCVQEDAKPRSANEPQARDDDDRKLMHTYTHTIIRTTCSIAITSKKKPSIEGT